MVDLKKPLLPPRPATTTNLRAQSDPQHEKTTFATVDPKQPLLPPRPATSANLRDPRQLSHGVDVLGLKNRGQGLKSWIRVDASAESQVIEVDKFTMMRRCDLPARDLRLLDPLFVYPSTILGREKAIVANLEQIRCIITADEVFLLNSLVAMCCCMWLSFRGG